MDNAETPTAATKTKESARIFSAPKASVVRQRSAS